MLLKVLVQIARALQSRVSNINRVLHRWVANPSITKCKARACLQENQMTESFYSLIVQYLNILSKLDILRLQRSSKRKSKKVLQNQESNLQEARKKTLHLSKVLKHNSCSSSKTLIKETKMNSSKQLMLSFLLKWRKKITLTKSWNSFCRSTLLCTSDTQISTHRTSLRKQQRRS